MGRNSVRTTSLLFSGVNISSWFSIFSPLVNWATETESLVVIICAIPLDTLQVGNLACFLMS